MRNPWVIDFLNKNLLLYFQINQRPISFSLSQEPTINMNYYQFSLKSNQNLASVYVNLKEYYLYSEWPLQADLKCFSVVAVISITALKMTYFLVEFLLFFPQEFPLFLAIQLNLISSMIVKNSIKLVIQGFFQYFLHFSESMNYKKYNE